MSLNSCTVEEHPSFLVKAGRHSKCGTCGTVPHRTSSYNMGAILCADDCETLCVRIKKRTHSFEAIASALNLNASIFFSESTQGPKFVKLV